ncbi:MAG: replication protein RepA [Acidobacteriota bacterium]|nr:replication protein RepA [Acidobacteriota bacterium]
MADRPHLPTASVSPAVVPRQGVEARLLQESLLIEAEEARKAGALGFMARLLVQTTLPHSRRDSLYFVRTNGSLKVSVAAHPLLGLPYGRYPRLLMAWVTTEAVRTREPVLRLGPSLTAFMADLGLLAHGGRYGPIGRLRDQMQRLFGATIAFTWDQSSEGEWYDAGYRVTSETHLWWNPARPQQTVSWHSEIRLSPGFFEAVCQRPVPVDLRVLKVLRSSMALDLYCWLTYRNSYLRKPTRVPWPALAAQFGAGYQDRKDFKRKFLRAMRQVLVLYPSARVEQVRGGLKLKPSRSHVRKRLEP